MDRDPETGLVAGIKGVQHEKKIEWIEEVSLAGNTYWYHINDDGEKIVHFTDPRVFELDPP